MKYMGSKNKISIYIKEIIDLNRLQNQSYYEPMCGGCNMIDKIKGKRFASDNNKYLIALFIGLQKGKLYPKNITEEMYKNAQFDFKNNSNIYYSNFLIGFIGFMASFNGKFFNGYAKNENRNYIKESIKNIEAQMRYLIDVDFKYCDYFDVEYLPNSIIYFDIPYFDTTSYKINDFDYKKFYDFAELKSIQGNTIFISEYWMPEDRFTKIWSKQVQCGVTLNNSKRVESLFIPKNQISIYKKQQSLF